MAFPEIVGRDLWRKSRAAFLAEEKALMRAQDALNARRRRLPMTEVDPNAYSFSSPAGRHTFLDLFEGRPQLIVYHNMLRPDSDHICPGCSYYCDHIGRLEHLHARRTTFAVVSRARVEEIERVKARMGWSFPWYSAFGATYHEDFVNSESQHFGLSVFFSQKGRVFQSYFTSGRGIEQPSNTFGLLDLTPWGRQETWEDSPDGVPQEKAHSWIHLHDEYIV